MDTAVCQLTLPRLFVLKLTLDPTVLNTQARTALSWTRKVRHAWHDSCHSCKRLLAFDALLGH